MPDEIKQAIIEYIEKLINILNTYLNDIGVELPFVFKDAETE